MDMTAFAPRKIHPALAWLGKHEWLKFQAQLDFVTTAKLNIPQVPKQFKSQYDLMFKNANLLSLIYFWSVSRVLAFGPKVFLPTYEQCWAMRETEANIPLSFYHQPYDQFIVSFPKEFIRDLGKEFNMPLDQVPKVMLQCYEQETLVMATPLNKAEYVFVMSDRPEFKTIEDALHKNAGIEPQYLKKEAPIVAIMQRLAINFGCLMTYTGVTKPEPTANKIKLSKRKDERSQLLALGEPSYFGLLQKINLHEVKRSEVREGEGISPHPHWRKGHWRNQHFGVGNQQTKLIFIKPVFVCSHLFNGDLSTTSVEYKFGKNQN